MERLERSLAGAAATALVLGLCASSGAHAEDANVTYRAVLSPLNADVTGSAGAGEALFTIAGDALTIAVTAAGVPASTQHLQHFHGFAEGDRDATCPSAANDSNGDGIIDLIETEAVAGTTMVPFHDDPVSMEIVRDTYPTAGAEGGYSYEETVSLKALEAAFGPKFAGQALDLDRRVVFLHGVPAAVTLPASVASLGDIPAQITLPIACGEIVKVGN